MYVSASSRCVVGQSFFDACSLLTDLEYDRVEIWFDEAGEHLSPVAVADDPNAFASRYRESTRLTPVAFHLGCDVSNKVLAGLTEAAKMLRVAQITVPASPLGTPFNTEVDRLRSFVTAAGEDGIRMSIKTEQGTLTEDSHTAVELCQAVSGLGLTLDPSHYICGPNGGQSFKQVFPHVYHTHLRDSSPKKLQVPVGLGTVDYSQLISQLERENYRTALSVDMDTAQMSEDERALELRKLRMLLDSLL